MRVDARQAWFPPAGAPHARFSSSFSSNPRPPPPGPCPRPSVCRGQPTALRHGATGRRRPPRERGGRSRSRGVWGGGVGSPGCRLPSVAGCGLARRGRRRASGAGSPEGTCPRDMVWRRSLQAPGPDARFPARVKGRRRGARKRSAPCRTRRRRGRRRGQCGRDRRTGDRRRVNRGMGFPNASRAPDLLPGATGPGLDAPPPRGPVRPTAPAPPPGPHTPARSCTPAPPPRGDLPSTSHCRDSGSGSRTTDPRADRRGGMGGGQLS